ncbi:MAG TPA: Txe/YoeB family addiction module toxin [Pyrinomonadaceae bacterium]|nr:Txe/YoeB family addiction module toxin [Pyrinomonadaceae bacterium]
MEFDGAAFEDLAWWIQHDRRKALRIVDLIKDIQREPFQGVGKPEPLKHEFKGCWSRRIDQDIASSIKSWRTKSEFLRVDIITSSA